MADFARRRMMMVDTQVRPSDVTKYPIIEAMLAVPREAFVPEGREEAAYAGENLPLAPGRVMVEPRTLAKLLDAMDITPTDLVLILGTGMGYSAAVVARMAEAVVAVEEDAAMAADAERRLSAQGADNVAVVAGALAAGSARHGPYDAVLIEGGVETVPVALVQQLREDGRIGALFMENGVGTARIGIRRGGDVVWRSIFNAAAPVLPGFARPREFAL